jgi:hypothetical protein
MPKDSTAVLPEPSPAEGSADGDARHQQALADTHRLLELKREQVCILNAENDKQRELVADLEKRLEAERSSHSQSRAAAEEREAELMKKDEESKLPERDKPRALLTESFETFDVARWKSLGGNWTHSPGKLEQKMDGPTRAALRLLEKPPRDFDASLRFTILGGSQWRSVGITFDATQADPTQQAAATDSEQNVYVSAVAGGSKVQAAWHRGGQWMYPGGEAVRAMPIELNRTYTLRVQVRGTLVNATLDDEPVIAWESPLARNDGALQLITFDALCAFHEFTISPLDPKLPLRMPGSDPLSSPQTLKMAHAATESARADLKVAEAASAVAIAELESTRKRADAQRAEWDPADASRPEKTNAILHKNHKGNVDFGWKIVD